ncbi:DNA annealing helicase and endonuclease ZRANB3 [Labeo rohita]|uniref:DNA annealing helicase and endonuclease ZRANB3 n=1 Tax=Labeo rohita TaxID=84645 RepID=A0A498LLR2_LABRO|nr:DNA annealing helicase and endonuclease ZRANB3 [Labeo rohita]
MKFCEAEREKGVVHRFTCVLQLSDDGRKTIMPKMYLKCTKKLPTANSECVTFAASYIRIDGSVPSAERIQLVHRFQNDPDTRVAILSIQAAGQGLTFTAASHVVFAELYWNPGHIKQAEDRAHRIGQTTTVHIHYLIAKGTFDTVMWAMLNRKETVTGSALNGKKEYLKAEVGDQEKWDFLNFAQAWTPSDTIKGDSEDDKDGMFFSHFERDKQHDIRSFFSPSVNKEKKRKRTGDSPSDGSPLPQLPEGAELVQTAEIRSSDSKPDQGEDFSPQSFRLPHHVSLSLSPIANDVHFQKESDDSLPVYDCLKFCASKNTDRIYIYDKDGLPLHCNFIPLDIRLQNWEELPPEFNHSENRRQVVRFVREWSSLTAMRQRMIFLYLSRQDVAQTSITVAQKEGGALRIINKDNTGPKRKSTSKPTDPTDREAESSLCAQTSTTAGYLQAVDSAGTPLCLSCQKPSGEHHGWAGGFCSPACMEDFQLRSNQGYMRARVLETEQGVCQHCGLNAHQLYVQVRDAPRTHRKEILDNTWLAQLPLKQRTAQQVKDRSQMKRDQTASKLASDITRFFFKK